MQKNTDPLSNNAIMASNRNECESNASQTTHTRTQPVKFLELGGVVALSRGEFFPIGAPPQFLRLGRFLGLSCGKEFLGLGRVLVLSRGRPWSSPAGRVIARRRNHNDSWVIGDSDFDYSGNIEIDWDAQSHIDSVVIARSRRILL